MEYTSPKKSAIDMVYSMLDYGMIERKKKSPTKNGDCVIADYKSNALESNQVH